MFAVPTLRQQPPDSMVFCATWFDGTELRWQSFPSCLPLQFLWVYTQSCQQVLAAMSLPLCSIQSGGSHSPLSVVCTVLMVPFLLVCTVLMVSFPIVFQIALVKLGRVVWGCCSPSCVAGELLHLCQMSPMVSASKRT